jgi:hypothetical protein
MVNCDYPALASTEHVIHGLIRFTCK